MYGTILSTCNRHKTIIIASRLTAPPAQVATQLPQPHTPQPPAPADSLNQPLSLTESEAALQKLHNGRPGALLGYTSELLRYAKLSPSDDDPAPRFKTGDTTLPTTALWLSGSR